MERNVIVERVAQTVVTAGSTFFQSKTDVYRARISEESCDLTQWSMQTILDNALVAEERRSPLCDDTGIPHLILEVGRNRCVSGEFLDAVYEGVREGLRQLPGRPMAILGDDVQRVEQRSGLDARSEAVLPAPLMCRYVDEADMLRLTVLMQGGGPEIRAKTYRVFHRHSMDVVVDEVVAWASEAVAQLGCTPCTLAVGIGRSHYEASSLMLQAMAEGQHDVQSDLERSITERVNLTRVGSLGLGGDTTVLGTFLKIGPQRASGVRIVCMRPCCCFEPRRAAVDL